MVEQLETMSEVEWVEHLPGNNSDPLNQAHTLGWKFYVTLAGKTKPDDGFGAWMVVDEGRRDECKSLLDEELSIAADCVRGGEYQSLRQTWTSDENDPIRRTTMNRVTASIVDVIKQKIAERVSP